MKRAQIALLEYFATDLTLGTNRNFAPDKPLQYDEKELHIEVAVKQNADAPLQGGRWQVTLEIRHQPAPEVNFPYSYRTVLVGLFSIADTVKAEDEERWVKIQGASVLYGMAREIVRALTGRGPYRPVILPTFSFYENKPSASAPVATAESSSSPTKRRSRKKDPGQR